MAADQGSGGNSVPGRGWFDSYSLRAQWAPVLTVVGPAIFATYAILPDLVTLKGAAGGTILVAGLPPVLAQTARDFGKALEPGLWASWGGKPTTRMLRHRDTSIPEITKRRYFETLASAGIARPTIEEEDSNPAAADQVYDSAGDWLRRHTRDTKKAAFVASKNTSYGLARNLLGLRWIGVGLTVILGLACLWMASRAASTGSPAVSGLAAAASVNLGCALLWLIAVRPRWVRSAADAYALALLECCEPEVSAKPRRPGTASPPKPRTRPKQRPSDVAAPSTPASQEIGG
jgi:hypothetical protein